MDPVENIEIPQAILGTIEVARARSYIIIATTTLCAYDIFMALPGEIELLSRGFTLSDIVYWAARPTLVGFFIAMVILFLGMVQLIPNNGCETIVTIIVWFMVLSMILNSLLFVFRVRAVYLNSTKVTIIFSILWLTTLAQLLPPIAGELHMNSNGDPEDCAALLEMKPWVVIGFILTAIFDTAVFVAVSMQVLGFTGGVHTWKERMVSFLNGKELGNITKSVLQTGQLYYLVTIIADCFAIAGLVQSDSLSEPVRAAFALIGVVLQNITACAVFRLVKLRTIRPAPSSLPTSQEITSVRFAPQDHRTQTSGGTAPTMVS
ncbi:hypothetical protein QCA50_014876 [Cerrena zonata]|uniref:Uncharacterized protein n=1 Tax=Cerrena zonata TaxID=2478898 RepID=A0AAW0FQS0_9APHY